MPRITYALFILFLIVDNLWALNKQDLTFYDSFDKGFNAEIAKGAMLAKPYGHVRLVQGRNGVGQAAEFSSKGDFLEYAVKDNMNLPQGAIAFWVCELGTTPSQRIWNPYFQMLGGDSVFNILRLWQPINIAGGKWQAGQKICFADGQVAETGVWQHILFTWKRHEIDMYVNGKRTSSVDGIDFVFIKPGETFTLGRPKDPIRFADSFHTGEHMLKDAPAEAERLLIGKEPYGAYRLDDIAIFNRFLSPNEVEAIYKYPIDLALNKGLHGEPTVKLLNYVSSGKIRIEADFGEKLPAGSTVTARIAEADIQTTIVITPGGLEYGYLDTNKLKPGCYHVMIQAENDKGSVIAQILPKEFEKTAPEVWMTNTYGMEDVVLPGFEPLHAEGTTVKLWGRQYDLRGIMPSQIVNQQKNMLTRPINWYVRMNEEVIPFKVKKMNLVSSSPTRAIYEGEGNLATFNVRAKVTVEYDGFMKYEITFDPGSSPVTVDRLWMEIPLVPEQSTNYFYPTRRSGIWPGNWQSDMVLKYTNIATLGTPDISLQWLTESDQYYYPRGCNYAIQTENRDKERIFRTNIIGDRKVVKRPMTLVFALEAGPVKAKPANWRGWVPPTRKYLDPIRHNPVAYQYDWWARSPGDLIPRQGLPDKKDPNLFKDEAHYTSMHFAGWRDFQEKDPQKRLPEWQKYETEWLRVPVESPGGPAPGWMETYVDTNSSWGQWHIYNLYQLFEKTGMRGIYYDDWMSGVSMNEAAGSGYIDEDGIRRPTHPIYSQRELHRRIYAIVHSHRPKDGFIFIHTASSILLPIVAFCDVIYDGEIFGWSDLVPPEGDYFATYSNDLFQSLYGKQYGPIPGFHDWTQKAAMLPKCGGIIYSMANQRKLWAKLLLHDIHYQDAFTSGSELLRYFWLDYFDIADPGVKFFSYWDTNPVAKVIRGYWPDTKSEDNQSKIWAVAYVKPDGRVLVVVVRDAPNNFCGDIMVDIQLDRKRLGLSSERLKCTDLESLGRTPKGTICGDVLTVSVGVDDFAAIVIDSDKK